ncbi:MAG: ribbon-helix-helix protein, CopG family [Paracoccus sp. (in: a-proteobacteria)]
MPKSEKKKMGRPRVNSTSINLRLPPDLLDWLDTERAKLDDQPSRPEMIRQVLEERKGREV